MNILPMMDFSIRYLYISRPAFGSFSWRIKGVIQFHIPYHISRRSEKMNVSWGIAEDDLAAISYLPMSGAAGSARSAKGIISQEDAFVKICGCSQDLNGFKSKGFSR
jgi:hypothetical protein